MTEIPAELFTGNDEHVVKIAAELHRCFADPANILGLPADTAMTVTVVGVSFAGVGIAIQVVDDATGERFVVSRRLDGVISIWHTVHGRHELELNDERRYDVIAEVVAVRILGLARVGA